MAASLLKKMYAEALGSFILVFTLEASKGNVFCVAGIIWLIMISTKFVSGAMVNPAVTVSVAIKKLLDKQLSSSELLEFIGYIIVQFVSGILGGLCAWTLIKNSIYFDFEKNYPDLGAFVCEAFYTTVLCLNVLMVGKHKGALYCEGLFVCLTIFVGGNTIAHLTGNCLNPMFGVSMNVISLIDKQKHLANLYVYIASPLTGAVVAAVLSHLYHMVRDDEKLYRTSLTFDINALANLTINDEKAEGDLAEPLIVRKDH